MHEPLEITYQRATTWLSEYYPFIANGLLFNDPTIDEIGRQYAMQVLDYYLRKNQASIECLPQGLTAFGRVTFDFIKLQARFLKKGHYHHQDATEIIEKLYLNSENMKGYYLDGLLLSYAFWPNHARFMRLLIENFLANLPPHSHIGEIGSGHGLMALLTLCYSPTSHYWGMDISPFAIEYATELLIKNGIPLTRFDLQLGDITQSSDFFEERFDAIICCEVLEHVKTPEKVLAVLYQALVPQGKAFITTVANIEAEDHIYLFTNAFQIRNLLEEQGFSVVEERIYPLKGMEQVKPLPLNYVAVVTK